ncbi:MAG: metal ABC transporter permease [Candidatus Poseidoniales archaeon]
MRMLGGWLLALFAPLMEWIAPLIPGDIFPFFFTMELFQRALLAAVVVTVVSAAMGCFLLIRNMALIGDGLAHVSFGGVAVGLVMSFYSPMLVALAFSIVAAIIIHELQEREILTGDTAIAIFLTGMLAFGLVALRLWGGGVRADIDGYLFGNLLLIDEASLDLICIIGAIALVLLGMMRGGLLATAVDPVAARVQGIPVRQIGLVFSVLTAAVVVSMVQVIGVLLVTALLVTPAATAQLVGKSFRSCMAWAQFFGLMSVFIGLYFSAELGTGSGSMIALVSAIIFASVGLFTTVQKRIILRNENMN